MARFDLYRARERSSGYVIDVQADILEALETRVVIPLTPHTKPPRPAQRLNPHFEIEGVDYTLQTQWISVVSRSGLGRPIGNLVQFWDEITIALDMLFTGF